MRELDKALTDIDAIRSQIAAGTAFRGYGPAAVAATGGLALVTALAQSLWLGEALAAPIGFFAVWTGTALIAAGIVWIEMRRRARRHHSGLADAMIHQAVEQFLPAAAAGVALPLFFLRFAPETAWMMPGLWQMLVGLGIFASIRSLPRSVALVGGWYFAAGIVVLVLSDGTRSLSPWTMGLPFVAGQFLMAALLHRAFGGRHGED